MRLNRIGFVVAGLLVGGVGFPVAKGSAQSVPVDPYVAAVDADGPLSHWRMGEATVSEPVVDRVSSQNGAATTTSRLSVGAWPGSGGATLFNGSGGVATTRLQTSVSAFSVEAWGETGPGFGSCPTERHGVDSYREFAWEQGLLMGVVFPLKRCTVVVLGVFGLVCMVIIFVSAVLVTLELMTVSGITWLVLGPHLLVRVLHRTSSVFMWDGRLDSWDRRVLLRD